MQRVRFFKTIILRWFIFLKRFRKLKKKHLEHRSHSELKLHPKINIIIFQRDVWLAGGVDVLSLQALKKE